MKEIQSLIEQAVTNKIISAAAVAVIEQEQPIVSMYAGQSMREDRGVDSKSLFDLASLTKVMSTTWLVGMSIDAKELNLEQPMRDLFSGLPKTVGSMTWHDLLCHQSGWPAWVDFSKVSHDQLLNALGSIDPIHDRGATTVYSDLNYLMLGLALEKIHQQSLQGLFQNARISMSEKLGYIWDMGQSNEFIPTGNSELRQNICGEVFDDNAFYLKKATGHAGLMGTLPGVCQWWQLYQSSLSKHTQQLFFKAHAAADGSMHCLGWDVPTKNSSAGDRASKAARGHMGYTGTSLWYDPTCKTMVVTLTNRTHCQTSKKQMLAFRQELHNTVWETIV